MNKKEAETYKKNISQQKAPEALIEKTIQKMKTQQNAAGSASRPIPIKRITAAAAVLFLFISGGALLMRDQIVMNEITALDLDRTELGRNQTGREAWTIEQLESYIGSTLTHLNSKWELQSGKTTASLNQQKEPEEIYAILSYREPYSGTIHLSINGRINEKSFQGGKASKVKGIIVHFYKAGKDYYALFQKEDNAYWINSGDLRQKDFVAFVKFLLD